MSDYEKIREIWSDRDIIDGAGLSLALNGNAVSYAFNSGKIENVNITYNDTREIFDHDGVTSYTGDLRTLFEIRNSRDAFNLFIDYYDEERPFSEELIKSLQKELMKNTYDERRWKLGERPGEYKKNDYVTGRYEVGAPPQLVKEEMEELLSEFEGIAAEDALTAGAFFHCKFENIHPFADGNGRTGRMAMNYLFVKLGHPFVVIHEEDRKAYYSALEAWDRDQKLELMKAFIREQTVKSYRRWLE